MKILIAVLVFGIIIFVHELGHFLMARAMGVKVNEFAIGMGPTLLRFGKKETRYSLRAFPIGGFCAMEGEDDDSSDQRAFGNKRVWRRILIVVAGVLMNMILGYVLLLVDCAVYTRPAPGQDTALYATMTIAQMPETSPAYRTGLRARDKMLKVNGKRVVTYMDLSAIMQNDEDGKFDMLIERNGETLALSDVEFTLNTDEKTGARYLVYDFKLLGTPKTVWSTLAYAGKMEYSIGVMIWRNLGDIVTGRYGLNDLSGPVGVVDAIGDAAIRTDDEGNMSADIESLLLLAAMITVNVGIFNLLPLPALDGGRLLFLIIEGITRRKVPAKYEGIVHLIGMLLLFGLMIAVTYNDIVRLVTGG
ncbi:MAG: M50 family metallopeptidase [Acutalibacteraceae bacterium]